MGRLRAESLNLVDAELAVRITRWLRHGFPQVTTRDRSRPASRQKDYPA